MMKIMSPFFLRFPPEATILSWRIFGKKAATVDTRSMENTRATARMSEIVGISVVYWISI